MTENYQAVDRKKEGKYTLGIVLASLIAAVFLIIIYPAIAVPSKNDVQPSDTSSDTLSGLLRTLFIFWEYC